MEEMPSSLNQTAAIGKDFGRHFCGQPAGDKFGLAAVGAMPDYVGRIAICGSDDISLYRGNSVKY
jgi:hypothetical protein